MPWRCACLAPLLLLAAAVTKPDGCPDERWTGSCAGSATCASLAEAGLICGDQDGGVGIISGCKDQCAEPCCITTTTTTTQSTITMTSTATHTMTTMTATITVTDTSTSITSTHTGSTVTITGTGTHTVTETTVTATETTVTVVTTAPTTVQTTPAVETTLAEGPFRRLAVRIKVTGVTDDTRYVTDSRVSTAYRETIQEITGLGEDVVDLQMVVDAPGNLTVTYLLNIPEATAADSMAQVEESLMKETASSFNSKLQEHLDALVGHGVYTQQVLSMESVEEDGTIGIGAAEGPRGTSMWMVVVALAALCG